MANFGDGFYNGEIIWILVHLFHKGAIDLEKVHWQIFQVGIGRLPASEIVKRESATALFLQFVDKFRGARQVRNAHCFRDFETDLVHRNFVRFSLADDEINQAFFIKRSAGQIDCQPAQFIQPVAAIRHPAESVLDHPAVNIGHAAEVFGRHDQVDRGNQLSIAIRHTQQHLGVMHCHVVSADMDNRLAAQFEAVIVQSLVYPAHPFDCVDMARQIGFVRTIYLHIIGALGARNTTACFGCLHQGFDAFTLALDFHQPGAEGERQALALGSEAVGPKSTSQAGSHAQCVVKATVLDQHGKLVAADTGKQVICAQLLSDQTGMSRPVRDHPLRSQKCC